MHKYITYYIFVIASFLVVVLFVTATTYAQLILAVLLYPALAYFALRIFSKRIVRVPSPAQVAPSVAASAAISEDALDIDKRAFLKLVGATGIFFFLSTLLGKRLDAFLFGRTFIGEANNPPSVPNSQASEPGSPVTAGGYQITEVDDNVVTFFGFTKQDGSWLIMREDTDTSSFRYAKGESDFPRNWASRDKLEYDYYYNLF